jgi:hypothetical protein
MPENRRPCPGVWNGASGGPAQYGEQLDCLKSNPQEMQWSIRRKDARHRRAPCDGMACLPTQPPGRRAMPNEGIKGDEWAT